MESFLDVARKEVRRCGIINIPLLNERLCTSIGCHLINYSNLKDKRFYHAGALENFRQHMIVIAQSGFGKCLLGDTLVTLGDGTQKLITQLTKEDTLLSCSADWKLKTVPIKRVYINGFREAYKLTTASGRTLNLTSNHPLRLVDKWKSIDGGLSVGDLIALPRTYLPYDTQNNYPLHDAIIFAYMIAEGSCRSRHLKFSHSILQNISEFDTLLRNYYSMKLKTFRPGEHCLQSKVKWAVVQHKLKAKLKPILGKYSYEKEIPIDLMNAKVDVIRVFLNRYLACDGWASINNQNAYEIGISTSSKVLSHQLVHLFLRCGVFMKLRCKKTPCKPNYVIATTDAKQALMIIDTIGIQGKETQCTAIKQNILGKKYNPNLDCIDKGHCIKIFKGSRYELQMKGYHLWDDKCRTIGRPKLKKISTLMPNNKALMDLATSDIYWDKIKSITPVGIRQTYDLETGDSDHCFFANNILVHNSQSLGFYLNSNYGLLSTLQDIVPTDIRSTFSPESWLGTIYQNTDDKGNTTVKSKGIFNRFKTGILGADEFMRLKLLAENEVSTNEEVYLLSGLESDKASKDLALGEITEKDIGTTIWGGMRYTRLDTTSGLLRRFTFHLFFPTPTLAHQFRMANRRETIKNSISHNSRNRIKEIVDATLEDITDINTINYSKLNTYLDLHNVPHFEETIYRRMATGYSIATGTFPTINMDSTLQALIDNERWGRNVIRTNPEREAIYQVVKQEKNTMTHKELKSFFVTYYLMDPRKFNVLFHDLCQADKLTSQNNRVYIK